MISTDQSDTSNNIYRSPVFLSCVESDMGSDMNGDRDSRVHLEREDRCVDVDRKAVEVSSRVEVEDVRHCSLVLLPSIVCC